MILWDTNILIDFWKNPKELNKLNISKVNILSAVL